MNWTEIYTLLSKPFPSSCIKWRAGATTKDKSKAQALAYADARVYEDRLNEVIAGDWSVSFRPWGNDKVICDLTVLNVTRSSTGESGNDSFSQGTTAEAQAFKRACSRFGLGRYLYDLPVYWVAFDPQKKQLLATPQLPKFSEEEKLDSWRARAMHIELGKLPLITSSEHYSLASEVTGREITSFTQLTIKEASAIWKYVKELNEERKLATAA